LRESITREEDTIENSEPKGDENHWRRKIAHRILNSQGDENYWRRKIANRILNSQGDENHWRRKTAHTEF
jgi:hypothetical protein